MSGDSSNRRFGRNLIVLVLCFLTFTFAVEAKLAWYLPRHTMGSEVQAAKALPADTRQITLQALPDHNPIFPLLTLTLLMAFLPARRHVAVSFWRTTNKVHSPISSSNFSPANFFRPPPAR